MLLVCIHMGRPLAGGRMLGRGQDVGQKGLRQADGGNCVEVKKALGNLSRGLFC